MRTDLGWGINGRVCVTLSQDLDGNRGFWTNKIVTREVTSLHEGAKPCYGAKFALKTRVKEVFSSSQVREMFELDFQERCKGKNERSLSIEDQRFLNILDEGVHKREDGHYEMPLSLRSEEMRLPNNRSLALRRLFHLKTCFQRDSSYYQDYMKFMKKVIDDCAEKCPEEDSNRAGRIPMYHIMAFTILRNLGKYVFLIAVPSMPVPR